MKIDYVVLNSAIAKDTASLVEAQGLSLAEPGKVYVIEDKVVPANDPQVSTDQQYMLAFAQKQQTEYVYGQAMASHYLLDYVLQGTETVAAGDPDILMVGAAGALGVCLNSEQLAEAMLTGEVDIVVPEVFTIEVTGSLGAGVDMGTAARAMVQELGAAAAGKIVEFVDGGGSLSLEDKMILCGYCQKLGAWSARFVAEAQARDYVLALNKITAAKLPQGAVTAVFIGGAYGGSLEAIKLTAAMVKGKQIADKVRLSVAPASSKIYVEAADAGYIEAIVEAGGLVLNQCAVPPVQARIGAGEVMLSNDIHDEQDYAGKDGVIYLTSTQAAVEAALTGKTGGED